MIIALDPGGTTGVAILYNTVPVVSEWNDWMRVAEMVEAFADSGSLDHVVYESFHITQNTIKLARSYDALWLIGAIMHICSKYSVPATPQKPAERKFATDAKLKRLGWNVTGDHQKQATRHLLVWCWNHGMFEAKDLVDGVS